MQKNIFSLAALLIASAAFVACSSDSDSIIEEPQPVNPTGKYTLTINASKGGNEAPTRALGLSADGKTLNATWKTDENVYVMKLVESTDQFGYSNYTPTWATGSLSPQANGAEATLTGTLSGYDIAKGDELTLQFPRSGDLDYRGQDGTLEKIASTYDYAIAKITVASVDEGGNINISSTDNPVVFENQQAIVRFTLLDKAGNAINPTALTVYPAVKEAQYQNEAASLVGVGTSLTITPDGSTNVVYAALRGVTNRNFTLTATVGDNTYTYSKSGVTFEHGKFYDITVKMAHTPKTYNLAAVTGDITLKDGDTATGTLAGDYKVSIANGATVTLSGVTITSIPDDPSHKWAGINCPGDATIVLASGTTNTVKGGDRMYPGIYIAPDKTLTIEGSGTLDARSNGNYPDGAGIGGGYNIACGNIVIKGGNITAAGGRGAAGIGGGFKSSTGDASWGYITISGGNITATGGQISTGTSGTIYGGAGIGSGGGTSYRCGQINITGGTINATGGQNAAGIGGGSDSSCGGITISGGTVDVYGGQNAVAIGTGVRVTSNGAPFCGNINITNGVTRVTATKGTDSSSTIGATSGGTRGKITIGGVEFNASITDSPYTYIPQINE